jgi:hypothetical protein
VICDGNETFSNIPPPANDTVDEAGASPTDVNSESAAHEEEQCVHLRKTQDSRSYSGSRNGGRSRAKGQTKENILLTATRNISNILSESVALQRDERQRDKFGNKSFLLSFLPLMDSLPSELAIEARYKITEVFRNISAARQASLSAVSPASAFAASPVSIITNVSDTSEENFNILDFCHL